MVLKSPDFKSEKDISGFENLGTIPISPRKVLVIDLLVVCKTDFLEGHPISVKSPSLLIYDGTEPHRFQISDPYLEI